MSGAGQGSGTVPMTYHEEQLLRSLASRVAIGDLTVRLNRAQEMGDANAWLAGFLPEGQLRVPGRDPVEGHPGLLAYLQSLPPGRIHLSADGTIEVSGVNAWQDARYLVLGPRSDGNGIAVEAVGRHVDELVYERGEWYVAKRQLIPSGAKGS
jgi:SnoaL-like protein